MTKNIPIPKKPTKSFNGLQSAFTFGSKGIDCQQINSISIIPFQKTKAGNTEYCSSTSWMARNNTYGKKFELLYLYVLNTQHATQY